MQINISKASWHYRVYNWWAEFSGYSKPEWFRENFCHYVRVVVFWAPLGWFFRKPVIGWARPWMLSAVLATVLGTILGLIYEPEVTIQFWLTILAAFLIVGFIFFLGWLLALYNKRVSAFFEKVGDGLMRVLTTILYPVGLVMSPVWKYFLRPVYFKHHSLVFAAWILTFLGVNVMLYFLSIPILVMLWMGIAVVSGSVLAIFGVLLFCYGIARILAWLDRRKRQRRSTGESTGYREKGIGTIGLMREYRRTKWGSLICPFINILADDE